jgi:hypothetical protein
MAGTKAGLPDPTISSKFEGVKSMTLLAIAPLKMDRMQTRSENVYIKERIIDQNTDEDGVAWPLPSSHSLEIIPDYQSRKFAFSLYKDGEELKEILADWLRVWNGSIVVEEIEEDLDEKENEEES